MACDDATSVSEHDAGVIHGVLSLVSPFHATEQLHQFIKLLSLLLGFAAANRVLDTGRCVGLEHLVFDLPEGRLDRTDLVQDVLAIALLLDH